MVRQVSCGGIRLRLLQRLPLRFKIASVAALVLYLMMLALGILTVIVDDLIATSRDQDRSNEVMHVTERLHSALSDMQSGVRGYVITRESDYLEQYYIGAANYPVLLDRLAELVARDNRQVQTLATLQPLINEFAKTNLKEQIARVTSSQDATMGAAEGQALMDRIRSLLNEMQVHEAELAARLEREAATAASRTQLATWAVAGATAVIGLFLAFALANTITRPIKLLVSASAALARGDTGRKVNIPGADEIGTLAESFNAMSESLHQQMLENSRQAEELQAQQQELASQNEELQAQQQVLAATLDQLEVDRARLTTLNQFFQELIASGDLQTMSQILLTHFLVAGRAQVGAVTLLHPDGSAEVAASVGLTEASIGAKRAVGFVAEAARTGQPITVQYPAGQLLRPIYHAELPVEHEIYLPIPYSDQVLAVAALGRTGPEPIPEYEAHWLRVMAVQAGAALSNRLAYEKLSAAYAELKIRTNLIEDLTADVQAERDRARWQRDNLDAILRSTSEGFWLVDDQGQTLLMNDRLREFLRLEPGLNPGIEEVAQQFGPLLRIPEQAEQFLTLVGSDEGSVVDILELNGPAETYLQRFSTAVFGNDGRRIGRLFVLRDVTRETEVDRMKSEFISTVSHELRTPLTSIRGYVDLVLDGDAGPVTGEQREFLQLVSISTVRLSNLINDLLDVERIESGRIEMRKAPLDVAGILQYVTRSFQVTAQNKGLQLHLEIDGPLPTIESDGDRVTQVFMNLVSNAIKYTREGEVRLQAGHVGSNLVIAVSDTGIGIAKENLPRLFQRFFRVDSEQTRRVSGAGLGLAITRAILGRLGGSIEVQSEPGKGSTFTVFLPVSELPTSRTH